MSSPPVSLSHTISLLAISGNRSILTDAFAPAMAGITNYMSGNLEPRMKVGYLRHSLSKRRALQVVNPIVPRGYYTAWTQIH